MLKMFEKIIRRSSCSLLSPCRLEKLLTVTAPCDGVSAENIFKKSWKIQSRGGMGGSLHIYLLITPPPPRVHLETVDHWGEVIRQLGCNNDYICSLKYICGKIPNVYIYVCVYIFVYMSVFTPVLPSSALMSPELCWCIDCVSPWLVTK